ncbi:hypothetical protein FM107_05540 [Sphingobacterium sp. JB170]|nr:hypothetical protein FM107_05540 [Sphingobacterium sp. JB170]
MRSVLFAIVQDFVTVGNKTRKAKSSKNARKAFFVRRSTLLDLSDEIKVGEKRQRSKQPLQRAGSSWLFRAE